MRTESRLAYSEALGHDLEYRVYTADRDANGFLVGQPIVAFPSMNGRVWDWEGWGMIEAVAQLIDAGRITLYCADGIDWQSWTNGGVPVEERARRHEAYEAYLVNELCSSSGREPGRTTCWPTRGRSRRCSPRRGYRQPSTIGATTPITIGRGGERCCRTTSSAFSTADRRDDALAPLAATAVDRRACRPDFGELKSFDLIGASRRRIGHVALRERLVRARAVGLRAGS